MDILAFRSHLLKTIRSYFESESLDEVTTPLLRDTGSVEVHLDSIKTQGYPGYFLQTSPEYAMKALVAKYRRSIYQICPAVRASENSSKHRIEFQILEWYRCGYDLSDLLEDLQALLDYIRDALSTKFELNIDFSQIETITYKQLFVERYGANPHRASVEQLRTLAGNLGLTHLGKDAIESDYLDGLFAGGIEPRLQAPVIVTEYPSCQSALADISTNQAGDEVSSRFELFANGLEIANAYQELDDPIELERRFDEHNRQRSILGKTRMAIDEALLDSAGSVGVYSGVAIGIERLAMCLIGAESIEEVSL